MKVYISGRFTGEAGKKDIQGLSAAVKDAGMQDFCFVRDIEHYKRVAGSQKDRWQKVYDELSACDALLVDVSNNPSGKSVIEVGMAYALRKPVIAALKQGTLYEQLFDGVTATVIEYKNYKDIIKPLKKFDKDRTFDVTDKSMLFVLLLFIGAVSSWSLAQVLLPAGIIWAVAYWFIVRAVFEPMRAFDRVIIYVPLAGIWLGGVWLLLPVAMLLAVAWAIIFWLVALLILQKKKFLL